MVDETRVVSLLSVPAKIGRCIAPVVPASVNGENAAKIFRAQLAMSLGAGHVQPSRSNILYYVLLENLLFS